MPPIRAHSPGATPAQAADCCILAFEQGNRLAVRRKAGSFALAFQGDGALGRLKACFPEHTPPAEGFAIDRPDGAGRVLFTQVGPTPSDASVEFRSIERLQNDQPALDPDLRGVLEALEPHLARVPYLALNENEYIYKFRPESERNRAIYARDRASTELYQSRLCAAIKAMARRYERTAEAPVALDFGAVRYVIPSHFGFCLGVKNAIERAYETLAENPGRRVFMLSDLIHNPFVNDDLLRRGLRFLQTDKGAPYAVDDQVAQPGRERPIWWDALTPDDIVIIPAFGATDEDKRRLARKGIAVYPHDATCMLVEKVWKAARAFGREGYTVIIHGKHEHEETKATFSNTRRYAPAVIVRNLEEARRLGEIIAADSPEERARFYELFAERHTPGFDVARDLARIAVVNQTTLLLNETREIIGYLRDLYARCFGPDVPGQPPRVGGAGRSDTLCYATQVNQDALSRALDQPLDAAFVVGGKNSSNTYQLFRLCEQRLGGRAFFIQSESNLRPGGQVEHYIFPGRSHGAHEGRTELRPLWADRETPPVRRILITGGASCPDGIIQQVIARLNSLFPTDRLRPIEAVLRDLEAMAAEMDAPPERG